MYRGIIYQFHLFQSLNEGESEISLSRFLFLLNNLNITIDEFYRLINEDSYNENEQLISKVSQAYYDNNVIVLKKYRDVELEKYNKFKVEYVRIMKDRIEDGRIAVRQVRQKYMKEVDEREKAGLSEDEADRLRDEYEKIVKDANSEIEVIKEEKEKELMTI